ncbi:MAG: Mn2+ and Fe2+ transporter of the NRAMP family-like protein, partial [Acidimicrobiaceae bacterium]
FGRVAFLAGFWAAVFASLLGVWQSVPYLYADFYGILKKMTPADRLEVVKVTSTPYRLALAFITLVPLPFAFTGQPIAIIILYTIVGSLFVPFLAATLLYLNNRVKWTEPVPHNAWYTNLLLTAILLLFAIVGASLRGAAWGAALRALSGSRRRRSWGSAFASWQESRPWCPPDHSCPPDVKCPPDGKCPPDE